MNELYQGKTIALVANTAWSLYNFRLGLIRELIRKGFHVVAIAPPDDYTRYLIDEGCTFEPVPIDNFGSNPIRDFRTFRSLIQIYKKHSIDFIFHYTIKPNIYGTFAAWWLGINSVAIVTGLGQLFTRRDWKTMIANFLYRVAFRGSKEVWFLNESDASVMIEKQLLPEEKAKYLPSEGVNTSQFQQYAYGLFSNGTVKFLFAGRLIVQKGVYDFVEAARMLKAKGVNAEFQILGIFDEKNPHGIKRSEMQKWVDEGVINYLGSANDVRPYFEKADCLVLPSYYREGVPRVLLEGASMQMPLIATDNVGCRLVVEDGVNGFRCKRKDPNSLADCMEKMAGLSIEERARFGLLGRRIVYMLFNEKIVVRRYLTALNEYLKLDLQIKPNKKAAANSTNAV
jgi:glycosyltransferase involved in cell wall biosynthesis